MDIRAAANLTDKLIAQRTSLLSKSVQDLCQLTQSQMHTEQHFQQPLDRAQRNPSQDMEHAHPAHQADAHTVLAHYLVGQIHNRQNPLLAYATPSRHDLMLYDLDRTGCDFNDLPRPMEPATSEFAPAVRATLGSVLHEGCRFVQGPKGRLGPRLSHLLLRRLGGVGFHERRRSICRVSCAICGRSARAELCNLFFQLGQTLGRHLHQRPEFLVFPVQRLA